MPFGDSEYLEAYYEWLCDRINLHSHTYDILIRELYGLPFECVLDLDRNRIEDGYVLRGYFHYSDGSTALERLGNKPCSILEVLVALAEKMDYMLADDDRGNRTHLWFWEMLSNLGLTDYTDMAFNVPFGQEAELYNEIYDICNRWMRREFNYRGAGSPFPLMNPPRDQREQHIIAQMNDYVIEKYVADEDLV